MEAGKTAKYIKYAIGEIILVVIGILIALQVNNWNEKRRSNNLEVKILKEIRSNLQNDILEIYEDIQLMEELNKGIGDIENYLKLNDQPADSFYRSCGMLRLTPHFSPITSGFELLQSQGLGLISNDSLRNTISFQYDMIYPYYQTYEQERSRFHALHSEPVLLDYFTMTFNEPKSNSNSGLGLYFEIDIDDYRRLKEDKKFLKLISAIAFENDIIKSRAIRVKTGILQLIDAINAELNEQ